MYCSTTVIFCGIFLLIPDQWKKFGTSFVKRHVTVYLSMCFFHIATFFPCSFCVNHLLQIFWPRLSIIAVIDFGCRSFTLPTAWQRNPTANAGRIVMAAAAAATTTTTTTTTGKKKHENHHWMFSTHLEFIWVKMSLFLPQSLESKNLEKSFSKHQFSNPPTIHHFSPHLKSPCTLRWAFA